MLGTFTKNHLLSHVECLPISIVFFLADSTGRDFIKMSSRQKVYLIKMAVSMKGLYNWDVHGMAKVGGSRQLRYGMYSTVDAEVCRLLASNKIPEHACHCLDQIMRYKD